MLLWDRLNRFPRGTDSELSQTRVWPLTLPILDWHSLFSQCVSQTGVHHFVEGRADMFIRPFFFYRCILYGYVCRIVHLFSGSLSDRKLSCRNHENILKRSEMASRLCIEEIRRSSMTPRISLLTVRSAGMYRYRGASDMPSCPTGQAFETALPRPCSQIMSLPEPSTRAL